MQLLKNRDFNLVVLSWDWHIYLLNPGVSTANDICRQFGLLCYSLCSYHKAINEVTWVLQFIFKIVVKYT